MVLGGGGGGCEGDGGRGGACVRVWDGERQGRAGEGHAAARARLTQQLLQLLHRVSRQVIPRQINYVVVGR